MERQSGPDPVRISTRRDLVRVVGLLRARAAAGTARTRVSLAALALRAGIPRSTVHSYLTGKHLPPSDLLDRIVIELGATPAEQREWNEAWFRLCTPAEHPPAPLAALRLAAELTATLAAGHPDPALSVVARQLADELRRTTSFGNATWPAQPGVPSATQ